MNHFQIAVCCCFLLFWANLAAAFVGHHIGRRQFLAHQDGQSGGASNVDAVILSLLGLLTAFTFSAAYSRYETRRQLIVNEANALGTAWLRLDLLPEEAQWRSACKSDPLRRGKRTHLGNDLTTGSCVVFRHSAV